MLKNDQLPNIDKTPIVDELVKIAALGFKQFKLSMKEINVNDDRYEHRVVAMSKNIYEYTKDLLDILSNKLTSKQKSIIFKQYLDLWRSTNCRLDISDTSYAELYKSSDFGKYNSGYCKKWPMITGFNLEGVTFADVDLINSVFLSVNLKGAQFSDGCLAYAHFENCDMTQVTTNKNSNLNQCRFVKCDLQTADLFAAQLNEVYFRECDVKGIILNKQNKRSLHFYDCQVDPNNKHAAPVMMSSMPPQSLNLFQPQESKGENCTSDMRFGN